MLERKIREFKTLKGKIIKARALLSLT
jgi:hypothetical protein